jgi:hypothetical protein
MRTRHLIPHLLAGLALALAGCSSGSSPTHTPAAGGPTPGGGPDGFTGTIATSGLYVATWTVGSDPDPFNAAGALTMTSDHQTFGNLSVKPDGSVSFGSAAPEMGKNLQFAGSGARVTLDGTGAFVCAFSVDTDLVGDGDGAILHVKGSMAVTWHAAGDLHCP